MFVICLLYVCYTVCYMFVICFFCFFQDRSWRHFTVCYMFVICLERGSPTSRLKLVRIAAAPKATCQRDPPGNNVVLKKKDVTRGTQATTLQLTPAKEGRNQRGRGPTVQTPSFEKLVTHTQFACRLRKKSYGTLQVLNGRCRHCFSGL